MRMLKMFWVISAMIILAAAVSAVGNLKTSILMNSSGSAILNLDTATFLGVCRGLTNSPNINVSSVNKVYYVKPNNATDIQVTIDKAYTVGKGKVVIDFPGNYQTTATIIVKDGVELTMSNGAWIKPSANINVISLKKTGSLGDIYVNVTATTGFNKSIVYMNGSENYWMPRIHSVYALGGNVGNGSVLHYKVDPTLSGSCGFGEFGVISGKGFKNVVLIEGENAGVLGNKWFNGNHFNLIISDYTQHAWKTVGNGSVNGNVVDFIEDERDRHISNDCVITFSARDNFNQMKISSWDYAANEYSLCFNESAYANEITGLVSTPPCYGGCRNNKVTRLDSPITSFDVYGTLPTNYVNSTLQAEAISITHNNVSSGKGLNIVNTGSTDYGAYIYTNMGATARYPLTYLYSDNSAFDQSVLSIRQDGAANSVDITQNTAPAANGIMYIDYNGAQSREAYGILIDMISAQVYTGLARATNTASDPGNYFYTGTAFAGDYSLEINSDDKDSNPMHIMGVGNQSFLVIDKTGKGAGAVVDVGNDGTGNWITLTGTGTGNAMDANSKPIVNIGNSGTDFDTKGGLTLAGNFSLPTNGKVSWGTAAWIRYNGTCLEKNDTVGRGCI